MEDQKMPQRVKQSLGSEMLPDKAGPKPHKRGGLLGALDWYLAWAIPGLGMFSEAYIVFLAGQIGFLQAVMWPDCYTTITVCDYDLVKHVASYILICGIIAGMLVWGFLGDITGRKWGSRSVAAIMLSGCILLTFSPFAPTGYGYFCYFVTAQTWYGFGVGGEYPMASASAAERSASTPELRRYRGRQVVLVFSNQGMGNLVNACVLTISMAIFGQTGATSTLTFTGARNTLCLTYGVGCFCALIMVIYRWIYLHESKLFENVEQMDEKLEAAAGGTGMSLGVKRYTRSLYYFWARQWIASFGWFANDFAFYGNKLQQALFIGLLYPTASPFKKQQWTILNNFISLLGYYAAAWLIDYRWYGRVRMQYIGFIAMFVFYIIIYAQWDHMGAKGAPQAGVHAFQALYYLSSFFNQFGPNATTWLVAGEIFPTDVRATNHGFAAAIGKVGAIVSSVWISYISNQDKVFLISALWGIGGAVATWIWLPDTTGLELEEYDRLQRYILEGRFHEYCGEAINPRHLSIWERYVYGWGKRYNPEQDKRNFENEIVRLSHIRPAMEVYQNMHVIDQERMHRLSHGATAA